MSLAEQHIGFAYSVADKIHRRYQWVDRDDLRAEAAYGLVEAERRYDPTRGTLFTTYAYNWVQNYVLRFIARNSRAVSVGNVELFWTLRRVRQKRSTVAEERLLAKRDEQETEALLQFVAGHDHSTSEVVGDDENFTLLDTLADPEDTARVHKIDSDNLADAVVSSLGEMRPVYETILHEMILADDSATLREIGDRYGLSRERIRQLRVKLVKRIAEHVQRLSTA